MACCCSLLKGSKRCAWNLSWARLCAELRPICSPLFAQQVLQSASGGLPAVSPQPCSKTRTFWLLPSGDGWKIQPGSRSGTVWPAALPCTGLTVSLCAVRPLSLLGLMMFCTSLLSFRACSRDHKKQSEVAQIGVSLPGQVASGLQAPAGATWRVPYDQGAI